MMRERMRLVRTDDSGITLVEVLVVMMLSALLMTIAGSFFVTVTRQTMDSEHIRRSTADASNIMNVVSTSIRASVRNAVSNSPNPNPDPAVVAANSRSITVITYTDAGPSFQTPLRLRYRVDNAGRMVEEQWQATVVNGYAVFPAITSSPASTRVLGNVVVNSNVDPLFRYYSTTGSQLGTGNADLTLEQRKAVTSVRFTVKVRADRSEKVVELDNTIGMPNMDLGLTE